MPRSNRAKRSGRPTSRDPKWTAAGRAGSCLCVRAAGLARLALALAAFVAVPPFAVAQDNVADPATWNPWNKESPEPYGYDVETAPDLPLGVVDPDDPPGVLPADPYREQRLSDARRAVLDLTTSLDRSAYAWFGRLTVTVAVEQAGLPVSGCDSVVVVSAANPRVRAYLADDGTAPDLAAGDGTYTGHFDLGAGEGEARPTGTYTVTATAYRNGDLGADDSPTFSLYSVRRWTGITTGGGVDTGDLYTNFSVTPLGDGFRHSIEGLGLVRSTSVTNAQIRVPILPAENAISNLVVTGAGVSNVQLRDNVIEFDCNLSSGTVARVDITFDAPSDLAATRIDRYQTGDIGLRNFRNGYLVWNRFIHTAIFGSGFSTPHGPGCIADLQVTDLESGEAHTVDCMERVAVHLDDVANNDGSGSYPGNIKWTGDALGWLEHGDLASLRFRFVSGGLYGLADQVEVTRQVTFFANARWFRHDYHVRNIDSVPHDFDFVWGREQWLYGTGPGSDRQMHDRGLLPNDPGAYGGEMRFHASEVDGPWFAAYDISSNYSIAVLLAQTTSEAMPTYVHFSCNPPLGATSVEYPIVPSGSCGNMENLFFEKALGTLAPGEATEYAFYQWGGYGETRQDLTDLLWSDANALAEPTAALEDPFEDAGRTSLRLETYPNPFDAGVSVRFEVPERAHATLGLYDVQGRRLATLLDAVLPAGSHVVDWTADRGRGIGANGVYFFRLGVGDREIARKVIARGGADRR